VCVFSLVDFVTARSRVAARSGSLVYSVSLCAILLSASPVSAVRCEF
jgi:hypothetical protein